MTRQRKPGGNRRFCKKLSRLRFYEPFLGFVEHTVVALLLMLIYVGSALLERRFENLSCVQELIQNTPT